MNTAFTGAGVVSAIGNCKEEVLDSLRRGRSGIGGMRYLPSKHKELPVGEVKLSDDEMKEMLGISPEKEMSRTVLMGILAVREALAGAGISKESRGTRRMVLVSGTSVGGMDVTERHLLAEGAMERLQSREPAPGEADFIRNHDAGSSTRQIADYFELFDDLTTVSTACSSASNAIILGAELLETGRADVVVAGGAEALTIFHLNGFNSLMILSREPCRPFDAARSGLNLGEGAGYLVMERAEDAKKRGAGILGYLTGYGNACDAFHQTASSPDGRGAFLAMKEALDMAGIRPEEIAYVNAHGTATENNDESESAALKRIFPVRMPLVSSTKAFTGHTTSASGGIETVICLLAIRHCFVPANLNFSSPMPGGITPTHGVGNVRFNDALCNSFGFGGNDTSLVISRIPGPAAKRGEIRDPAIFVKARREVTCTEELGAVTKYVKPLEARRMGKLMKASLLTAMQVLEDASLERPDAVITATAWGCVETSEKLLEQLAAEGEVLLKPTFFMQSTHNTLSGSIAVKTGCHGYNTTFTQGDDSLAWALKNARMLLESGRCGNVLVSCSDEATPLLRKLLLASGHPDIPDIHSVSILLSCGK